MTLNYQNTEDSKMNGRTFKHAGVAALIGAIAIVAFAPRAHSHHSFAMYDQTKDVTLTGRLVRFIPGGNHAQLIFQLVDESGQGQVDTNGDPVIWGVETGPSVTMARDGITVKSFPVDTVLTVTLNPLRDGRPFGALARGSSIIKCATPMPKQGCTAETGESFLGQRE
jgi:hypothetical protein